MKLGCPFRQGKPQSRLGAVWKSGSETPDKVKLGCQSLPPYSKSMGAAAEGQRPYFAKAMVRGLAAAWHMRSADEDRVVHGLEGDPIRFRPNRVLSGIPTAHYRFPSMKPIPSSSIQAFWPLANRKMSLPRTDRMEEPSGVRPGMTLSNLSMMPASLGQGRKLTKAIGSPSPPGLYLVPRTYPPVAEGRKETA